MAKVIPYLMVTNGKKAIALYEEIFNAKLASNMPFTKNRWPQMGLPDDFDYENSTMHAEIKIGRASIFLSDNPMCDISKNSGNVELVLKLTSKKQLDTIFNIVKKKKFKILMPLEKTLWGAWYTRFIDSNGIGWQLNLEVKQ